MSRHFPLWLLAALLGATTLPASSQGGGVQVLQESAGMLPVRARVLPRLGVGTVRVEVEVEDGGPRASSAVRYQRGVAVVADMPSMPRMRAEKATLRPADPASPDSGGGRARVSRWAGPLDLTMEGPWRLRFTVGTPHGAFQMVSMVEVRGEVASTSTPASAASLPATVAPTAPVAVRPGRPVAAGEGEAARRGATPDACCSPSPSPRAPSGSGRPGAPVQRGESVSIECLQRPPRVGSNRLRIVLPRGAAPGLPVAVGVDMPGMPMAVPPVQAARQADGTYLAEVPLSMAGLWHATAEAGPFLGKVALTVPTPPTPSPSRALLLGLLALSVPAGIALVLRGRAIAPLASSTSLLAAVLVAGTLIERRWPPDTSMGMVMDMSAPDMGMGDMVAPQPVLIAQAQRLPLERARSTPGWVRPGREQLVSAPCPGTVVSLVEPGQRVRRGAVVARMGAGQAVVAPLGGVVIERFARPGSSVASGTPLVVVGDMRTVRVEARLALDEIEELEPGAAVQVVGGSRTGEGVLERLPSLAEGQEAVITVAVDNVRRASRGMEMASAPRPRKRVTAPAPAEVFTAGQEVTLRYVVERIPSTLVIPASALHSDEDGTWIYVVATRAGQQLAQRRAISVGARSDAQVQVLSGLHEGEPVVAVCDPGLRDGMVVTPGHWGEGAWRAVLIPRDRAMKMTP